MGKKTWGQVHFCEKGSATPAEALVWMRFFKIVSVL